MQNVTNICPPAQGDMEQPLPGGGAPSLPSGAPAAEMDTGTKPGIPQCLYTISQAKPLVSPLLVIVNPTRGTVKSMKSNPTALSFSFFVVGSREQRTTQFSPCRAEL